MRKSLEAISKWLKGLGLKVSETKPEMCLCHGSDKIIITLGSKGAKHKGIVYPSPDPKETIDVSGAGDTFTAGFVVKYLETNDIGKSIEWGNYCAGEVVKEKGVSVFKK